MSKLTGELIPLELEFRGRAGPDYFFSTATGDRLGGGRERYEVTPPGGSDDPMADLLSSVSATRASSASKEPLLARFAAWSAEWRARESELEALAALPSAFDSPLVLENSLANALLNGRSFALTDDELARVRELCLTTGCRRIVDARPRSRGKR